MTSKGVREEGASSKLSKFALAIGSTKGTDPIPPDQYLTLQHCPLSKRAERLWAWLLSKTIRYGHRSTYAVDEEGKDLTLKHAGLDLGMDHGNIGHVWRELEAEGRVRKEGRRLCLNGEVRSPSLVANKERSRVRTNTFPPYLLEKINNLPAERRETLLIEYEREMTSEAKVLAEAVAGVRSIFDQRKDTLLARFGVKKIRAKKIREPKRDALLPELAEFIERSVQTTASPGLRVCTTPENGSVPTRASLLSSEVQRGPQRQSLSKEHSAGNGASSSSAVLNKMEVAFVEGEESRGHGRSTELQAICKPQAKPVPSSTNADDDEKPKPEMQTPSHEGEQADPWRELRKMVPELMVTQERQLRKVMNGKRMTPQTLLELALKNDPSKWVKGPVAALRFLAKDYSRPAAVVATEMEALLPPLPPPKPSKKELELQAAPRRSHRTKEETEALIAETAAKVRELQEGKAAAPRATGA